MARYRLTESKLRGIIREAVKGMLSELDWRTYDSAARKSYEIANSPGISPKDREKYVKRYFDFLDASEKAFNKEYAEYDEDGNGYFYRSRGDWEYPTSYVGSMNHAPIRNTFTPQDTYPITNAPFNSRQNDYSHKFGDAKKRGDRELYNYFNGLSKYVKGKGWE